MLSFLKSRRILITILLSTFACLLLLWLFPTSYGIYSVNSVKDTPLTRLLPVILGALAATSVQPVAPSAEATATSRLLRVRALTTLTIMAAQMVLLVSAITFWDFWGLFDMSSRDISIYLCATLFWQALCCTVVSFSSRSTVWLIPLSLLVFLLLYSWRDSDNPVVWNILLTINPLTITLTIIVFILCCIAIPTLDTNRLDARWNSLRN